MSNHNHDLDLVASLADGSVDPDEAERARKLVDECSRCRTEFEVQSAVLSVARDADTMVLTGTERRRMHKAVVAKGPSTTPAVSARWSWAMRLAPVAAVLVLVVGAGWVVVNLTSAGEDALTPMAQTEATSEASTDEPTELSDDGASAPVASGAATAPDRYEVLEEPTDAKVADFGAVSSSEIADAEALYSTWSRAAVTGADPAIACVDSLSNALVAVGNARYEGATVEVHIIESDGSLEVVVYDVNCETVEIP